jgi:hypothetical protein
MDMTLDHGGQTDDPSIDRVSSSGLAYPSDLTARVLERWDQARSAGEIDVPLPAATDLAAILSVCYHATLLREEGRVQFYDDARHELVHETNRDARIRDVVAWIEKV